MNIRTFRDLIAWQKAVELAKMVYRMTEPMPTTERFGLTLQMRKAAVSIPSNIAEGYARQSRTDYIRFLRVARGSLAELETQIIIAHDLNMLHKIQPLMNLLPETDRVLQGLIRSLEKGPERPQSTH